MPSEDTEEEASFRERYAQELQKKKQQDRDSYHGDDELVDEYLMQTSTLIIRKFDLSFYDVIE